MRFVLKDSERRADPPPLKTDDRKAILVGFVLWLVALGALLLALPTLLDRGDEWWLWTALVGLGLGVVMLLYTQRRHDR